MQTSNMTTREDCERFFREADKNDDGFLSYSELACMMRQKGFKGTDDEIRNYFIATDTSGDDRISMEEYLCVMGKLPPNVNKEAQMRLVFRSIDKDNNGIIDRNELKAVFKEMGQHHTEDEISRMMSFIDSNKDGKIDYEEFIKYFFNE